MKINNIQIVNINIYIEVNGNFFIHDEYARQELSQESAAFLLKN